MDKSKKKKVSEIDKALLKTMNSGFSISYKKKVVKEKREKIFDKLAPLLGKYLEACGWSCVLIAEEGIGTKDGKFRNYVQFSFLGKKKEKSK